MNGKIEPRVDVIVLLFKNAQFMPALFSGFAELDYPREKITLHLVDNGPEDGSLVEARRQISELSDKLPQIVVHEPGKNTGFTGGNNLVTRELLACPGEYIYLLNGDATFEPTALKEAVEAAENDLKIGAVQSLLVLQQNPDEINSEGNALHYLGFGYCLGYHKRRTEAPKDVVDIAYPSGAGVLLRNSVLEKVGLFDEALIAYHEDLDLGWRIRLAGYRVVLAPRSVVRHYYEFSRSISKWYLMERNRMIVLFKNYKIATLVWLLPQLVASEAALLVFAIVKGWWSDKLRVYGYMLKPSTWKYVGEERRKVNGLRKAKDRKILELTVPTIAYQDVESWPVKVFLNPVGKVLHWLTRVVVFW
ncbi:glycosyltransferase family 2 protein [Candidatus Uhrbacteria bacterium]|nr:glycosyltransferase family 2 protein [Candidatus Uhrbacteria bacterium]